MNCDPKILFLATEDAPGMRHFAFSCIKSLGNNACHAIIVIKKESDKRHFAGIEQYCNIHYLMRPSSALGKIVWHIMPHQLLTLIHDLIKKHGLEIIVTLTGEVCLSWQFNKLQRSIPILHTVHDVTAHDYKLSVINTLKGKIFVTGPNKMIQRKSKNLVSCSNDQVAWLQRHYPDKNVSYLPFPSLVTPSIETGKKAVPELEGIKDYILFFGRVEYYKGVHLLCDAFLQHKASWGGRKLVIAGKGDYGNYYFHIDDNKDVVQLNRFIEDEQVRQLFENAAIVVYPYLSATQTGVLSIASYFNKKIVASKVPYFAHAATDCDGVFLCDVHDISQLASTMIKAINSTASTRELYEANYSEATLLKHFKEAVAQMSR